MKLQISLDAHLRRVEKAQVHRPTGVVLDVVGLVVEVGGLRAGVGDLLFIVREGHRELPLEVVGFRTGRLLATPLGPVAGVRPGARVVRSERGPVVTVGPGLLGRVVDSFGHPLDGGESLKTVDGTYPIHAPPPPAFSRKPIDRALRTGIRAIDGMLTLGSGQRVGIFAGAGIGKSTLLGMICRSSDADVNVIGLVGERGREVNDFIRNSLGPDGLARSVVVAATSDQPPLVRARGAETATAIAEYFRDQGKNVLLVMDSATRYAMALREAALAAGEPPATKGYPPSVFAALPRLLERTGTGSGVGVITALYTVLVEGDDLSDPIADAVRSILDGHVVLSRSLAEKNHYPAIDVLKSISRLAPEISSEGDLRAAGLVRDMMSAYREAQDLIQVGAYASGSDARVDVAIAATPHIDAFLKQKVGESSSFEESHRRLALLAQMRERGIRG